MSLWTLEQVDCLNAYQRHGRYHPFTCPNRSHADHEVRFGDLGALFATMSGWVCLDCGYTQDWAHGFMLTYNPNEHPNWWEGKLVGELADKVLSDYIGSNETGGVDDSKGVAGVPSSGQGTRSS